MDELIFKLLTSITATLTTFSLFVSVEQRQTQSLQKPTISVTTRTDRKNPVKLTGNVANFLSNRSQFI